MVSASRGRQVGRLLTFTAAAIIVVVAVIWALADFNNSSPNRAGLATAGSPTGVVAGVGETFTVGTTTITVTALNATNASLRWPTSTATVAQYNLSIGQSVPVGAGYTVTLFSVSRTTWKAQFEVAAMALACDATPRQTSYCRGASACCDGSCQLLPSCVGQADGQILTCGTRTLYCCSGVLSLLSCGGNA